MSPFGSTEEGGKAFPSKKRRGKDNKNLAYYKISEEEITINVEITISPDKILPQKFPQLPGEYLKLPKEKKKVTFMQQG